MSILNKLFKKENNENPYYSKLSKCLEKKGFTNRISFAYRLLGMPNSYENLDKLKGAIMTNSIKELRGATTFDVMRDNLELYLVNDDKNESYFVIFLDPFELLESEDVIEILPNMNKDLGFEPELIYQKD